MHLKTSSGKWRPSCPWERWVNCEVWFYSHDDIIKWKYFPRYRPFVRGIHRSPVNFPHKGQWRGALMFSLICAWINGWVNKREAGDWRRHRAHYDVTVMLTYWSIGMHVCVCKFTNHYLFVTFRTYGAKRLPLHIEAEKNGRHFPDKIFSYIFLNENIWISIQISLTFVSKGQIGNTPAFVQMMAWCRPGDKPLSEPMMVSLLTHICVTRPQSVVCYLDPWELI